MISPPSPLASIFLSTPSARRATKPGYRYSSLFRISIHALREEGDGLPPPCQVHDGHISIHALREEGDVKGCVLHSG